tara:strand:+ start:599 stop:904 length:306 start_codon:yes stop_codon:yes gene_type:complete
VSRATFGGLRSSQKACFLELPQGFLGVAAVGEELCIPQNGMKGPANRRVGSVLQTQLGEHAPELMLLLQVLGTGSELREDLLDARNEADFVALLERSVRQR